MKDPIVQEIHRVREEIAKEIKKRGISVMEYLKEIQEKYKDRLAKIKPLSISFKPIKPRKHRKA
ncbi:MAG: hypothetical protein HQM09_14635 [Candidatus Riflebacteria bacterium]|nr:hypothetical protein [Candidatus Riflebacteria bacterium]